MTDKNELGKIVRANLFAIKQILLKGAQPSTADTSVPNAPSGSRNQYQISDGTMVQTDKPLDVGAAVEVVTTEGAKPIPDGQYVINKDGQNYNVVTKNGSVLSMTPVEDADDDVRADLRVSPDIKANPSVSPTAPDVRANPSANPSTPEAMDAEQMAAQVNKNTQAIGALQTLCKQHAGTIAAHSTDLEKCKAALGIAEKSNTELRTMLQSAVAIIEAMSTDAIDTPATEIPTFRSFTKEKADRKEELAQFFAQARRTN